MRTTESEQTMGNEDQVESSRHSEGYLHKKEEADKWVEYWAVLHESYLQFYKHKTQDGGVTEIYIGAIELTSDTKCILGNKKRYGFPFYIVKRSKRYLFKTSCTLSRKRWVDSIELSIQSIHGSSPTLHNSRIPTKTSSSPPHDKILLSEYIRELSVEVVKYRKTSRKYSSEFLVTNNETNVVGNECGDDVGRRYSNGCCCHEDIRHCYGDIVRCDGNCCNNGDKMGDELCSDENNNPVTQPTPINSNNVNRSSKSSIFDRLFSVISSRKNEKEKDKRILSMNDEHILDEEIVKLL